MRTLNQSMRILTLSTLCVLWISPVPFARAEDCPRKEAPPGVVIVSPGSELNLTCSGRVSVGGAKVVSNSQDFSATVIHSSVDSISQNTVQSEGEINPTHSSPRVSQTFSSKSDWDFANLEFRDEIEQEESRENENKFNIQWKFNGKDMEGNTEGPTLTLSRLRMSDSGRYSCHDGGTERFSTRVIVADAPEKPRLSCYKKFPSSKIRCEWTPQKPVLKGTSCSLLIRKGWIGEFDRVPCSYSTRRSRCWCARPFDEEDKRKLHQAVLCVSSFNINTKSDPLFFKPFDILKPDPPYNVSVQPQGGRSHSLMITWRSPYSWSRKDFYALIYQIRYKPLTSIHYQSINVSTTRHIVTDALVGQEYEVQVRTKDEYEGQWSDWSDPQYGHSWTEVPKVDLITTPAFPYWYSEGSGSGSGAEDLTEGISASPGIVSHLYLWMAIIISFALAGIIFVVFIIRNKHKCISKLQSVGVLAQCSGSVHPRPSHTPAVTEGEGHALLNKDLPQNEVKPRSEQELANGERTEATNFNNTSYFFIHSKI